MKCEDIKTELTAYLDNDLSDQMHGEVKKHLIKCQNCMRDLESQKKLSEVLRTWKGIESSSYSYEKLESKIESNESFLGKVFSYSFVKKAAFRFTEVVAVVAFTLVISHWLERPQQKEMDNFNTISLFLSAHRGAVLQTVSHDLSSELETRIPSRIEDFLYYEQIDGFPRYTRPGVIFRGPPDLLKEIPSRKEPSISKGENLDLSQARIAVDFEPIAPTRLFPGYILDSVRKIEDYNSLHLIYTNGISTLSLFEQALNGKNILAAQDFREYAIYSSKQFSPKIGKTPDKSTVLAWKEEDVSFVLIGNEEMYRLMEIAQAFGVMIEK